MSRQLPLALPPLERHSRGDFLVTGANRLALAAIEGWRDWPSGKMLLIGPRGAGKTHLSAIWAAETGAARVTGADLTPADAGRLARAGAVLVEDAEALAGREGRERALFHLHNLLSLSGRLLVTAASPPRDWGLHLPDLLSRMQATALTRIEPPDDALLQGVLAKLFADRQIEVTPALLSFLVARMPRSIGAARRLVAAIDGRALAVRRPVGIRLAADVLAELTCE